MPSAHISVSSDADVAQLTVRQVSNSLRRTGNSRRDFSALDGAGIGVFYIYIESAVAGPFGQKQRLQFTRFDYLFCARVSFDSFTSACPRCNIYDTNPQSSPATLCSIPCNSFFRVYQGHGWLRWYRGIARQRWRSSCACSGYSS